jgi:CheY-like chemotaxis protein
MTILVLVVEDEPVICMNAVAVIEDAGYDVVEASNADDAILLLEARTDTRVVFSDIEMPGSMDGLKLIHAVRKRWPPVVLILASGRVSPSAADMPEKTVFLGKPYAEVDLLKVLAAIGQIAVPPAEREMAIQLLVFASDCSEKRIPLFGPMHQLASFATLRVSVTISPSGSHA